MFDFVTSIAKFFDDNFDVNLYSSVHPVIEFIEVSVDWNVLCWILYCESIALYYMYNVVTVFCTLTRGVGVCATILHCYFWSVNCLIC